MMEKRRNNTQSQTVSQLKSTFYYNIYFYSVSVVAGHTVL